MAPEHVPEHYLQRLSPAMATSRPSRYDLPRCDGTKTPQRGHVRRRLGVKCAAKRFAFSRPSPARYGNRPSSFPTAARSAPKPSDVCPRASVPPTGSVAASPHLIYMCGFMLRASAARSLPPPRPRFCASLLLRYSTPMSRRDARRPWKSCSRARAVRLRRVLSCILPGGRFRLLI